MTDRAHFLSRVQASGLDGWDALPFLEKVTSVAPGIIYVFNQQTQSNEYSNHSLGESLGYSVEEVQAMGATFLPTLCHPDDLGRVFEHFDKIKRLDDGAIAEVEYRMKHRDGDWVWLISHESVFDRDAGGNVLRHIGVATDITAQKLAEAEALREKQAANDANEELRSFAYSVSHDLKSPSITLELLLGELRHAMKETADDEATSLMDSAQKTVGRMQQLIEDVLHYTRVIGSAKFQDSVNLDQTFSDLLEDLKGEISRASARIEIDPMPSLPGDPVQLRILFQNLLGNAIRYRKPDTAPAISVSCRRTGPIVTISVKDDGIGIDPAMHDRIFQLFARLHGEKEYPGTGLGLATCRRIAANHNGSIRVDSAPGKGSTFSVSLPGAGLGSHH